MGAGGTADELPISWDEAREMLVVILLTAAIAIFMSPVLGYLDSHLDGSLHDDLAELTRNVSPTTGLLVFGAGLLIATTPTVDVVAGLRRAVVIVATVVVVSGTIAIVVEVTRGLPAGVLARLQTVFGRSGPATLLAATGGWLARRVERFAD